MMASDEVEIFHMGQHLAATLLWREDTPTKAKFH
jgi:hypothetical protein